MLVWAAGKYQLRGGGGGINDPQAVDDATRIERNSEEGDPTEVQRRPMIFCTSAFSQVLAGRLLVRRCGANVILETVPRHV
jgi:hypothetical protein